MRILGIDFTSAPSRVQPLWFARASVDEGSRVLVVERLEAHASFAAFDATLANATERTLLAIDAPFGLPRAFGEWAGLPATWSDAMGAIQSLGDRGFESLVTRFRARQPEGSKHPLRACDRLAGAASPINIIRPPVGKMFYQCATRLARSDWRIVPCRERESHRVALECYPALVARTLIGRTPYKGGDDASTRLDRQRAREQLLGRLLGEQEDRRLFDRYGLNVRFASAALRDQALADEGADALDAALCCVQAAWAWARREHGWGVPAQADAREGWIVDPVTNGL
jgi:predicted RNase H-like nuclease